MSRGHYYRVRDWDEIYENNRTRGMKIMQWVPVPNSHDGDGYNELVDHPAGAAHLGCWLGALQVASKCGQRGSLLREGGKPHTARTIARITGLDPETMQEALDRLSSPEIGWLEVVEMEDDAGAPQSSRSLPAPSPQSARTQLTMERNGRERKGKESSSSSSGSERTGAASPPDHAQADDDGKGESWVDDFHRDLASEGCKLRDFDYARLRDEAKEAKVWTEKNRRRWIAELANMTEALSSPFRWLESRIQIAQRRPGGGEPRKDRSNDFRIN